MMEPRLRFAEALFDELVQVPAEQRSSRLAALCAGDDELRALVEQLLKNDDSGMGSFLCRPVLTFERAGPAPTRIGRYEIVREIGRGGSGAVYEARRPARPAGSP